MERDEERGRVTEQISQTEARLTALTAQGFDRPRPARPDIRHLRATAEQLGAIQIDSVNILTRGHHLPFFSRLGPYPIAKLDELINDRQELIEVWAHQASYVPRSMEPIYRPRPAADGSSTFAEEMEARRPGYIEAVRRFVLENGPVTAGDLPDPGRGDKIAVEDLDLRRKDGTKYAKTSLAWGADHHRPNDGKAVLDHLAASGEVAVTGRSTTFEKLYADPALVQRESPLDEDEASRQLVRRALRALGVGTAKDVADYFCRRVGDTKPHLDEMVEEGSAIPAEVEGWKGTAFLDAKAAPKPIEACALLGLFDSLTWSRDRVRRLFDFEYSFEIYVPAAKRRYGYYVLPFLLGDRLVARVDLKADRQESTLRVLGAFSEERADPKTIVEPLRAELDFMRDWLGLEATSIGDRGDLAELLSEAD